jgi:hypothetical protein
MKDKKTNKGGQVQEQKFYILRYKVEISYSTLIEMMLRIYSATQEENLVNAIQEIKDFRANKDINNIVSDAFFLEKLILLEASGDIHPPLNIGELYKNVIEIKKKGGDT